MTPKNSNNTAPCTSATTSTCTTWTGQSIPALGIQVGQTMTDTMYRVACAVVEATDELNLTDMDLSCLLDKTPILPSNKTLRLVLQLLLDNQCSLKALIDQASGASGTIPPIVVNMKCLKKFDDFENEIPQDLNAALQSIVNQVCTSVTDIALLKNTAASLQLQIDNLPPVVPYTEPSIVTCITPTPKPTSQQVPLIVQDYCNYKDKVGQITDVQQAIARQPAGLNTLLGTVDGWILNPQNLSQSENNAWLLSANLLARIKNIEDNCCKATCKNITLVMQVTPNSDGDAITVQFSTYLGTNIPTGFLDDGNSVLTITDGKGGIIQYPIVVSEDVKQGPFSFAGLDLNAPMTASVSASLNSSTLTCQKCVSKQFIPSSGCPVCLITGTGTTGNVTVVYNPPGATIIQTLIVAPGSTAYIQKNSTIIGLNKTGDANVTSDCIDLNASDYVCAVVVYATSGGVPNAVTWENFNNDIQPVAVGFGGIEYQISGVTHGDPNQIAAKITAAVPVGLIQVIGVSTQNNAGVRYRDQIAMKVPSTLVSSLYIKFNVVDYGPLKVFAVACDTCCGPTSNPPTFGGITL